MASMGLLYRNGLIDSRDRDSLGSYQMWGLGDERREDVGTALGRRDGAGGVSGRAGRGSSGASAGDLAAAVGGAASAVARVTGFSLRWVEKLVARWNAEGPAGLGDRRRGNGAAPALDAAGLAGLAATLEQEPEDGGLWSGRKVAG